MQVSDVLAGRQVPPRDGALDALKLALAFCVVGIHGNLLRDVNPALGAIFADGLLRVAVPTFLLISGFFFARMTPRQVRIWLRRLAVIYGIWMAVYAPYWFDAATQSPARLARTLLLGYHHLWYLPALILGVALLSVLRRVSSGRLLVLAGLAYSAGLAMQHAGAFHLFADPAIDRRLNVTWLYRNALFLGFPFLALGFLMARHEAALHPARPVLAALLLAAAGLLAGEAFVLHLHADPAKSFDLLLMLPVVCPILLLWVRGIRAGSSSRVLAQVSTGIYLVHPLVLDRLRAATEITETPLVLATAVVSGLLSWIGLLVLQDITRTVFARGRRMGPPPAALGVQEASR